MFGFVLGSFQRELSEGLGCALNYEPKKINMAFGLIRVRNLHAGDIGSMLEHNLRTMPYLPENIKPNGFDEFGNHIRHNAKYTDVDFERSFEKRMANVVGQRKNSVVALEYVVGINDVNCWEKEGSQGTVKFTDFQEKVTNWLDERHGIGSVIAVFGHEDESNPHAHIIVVPIVEKTVKWKNQKGAGERIEKRLNARDYTGGREKLRKLQNDYFDFLTTKYNQKSSGVYEGIKGVDIFRGTLVENQTKEYINNTNHEIGGLRNVLAVLSDEKARLIIQLQINAKEEIIAKKEIKLKEEENRRSSEKKGLWKLKGVRDNQEIFHSKTENTPIKKRRSI